jgi:hypothetical protein
MQRKAAGDKPPAAKYAPSIVPMNAPLRDALCGSIDGRASDISIARYRLRAASIVIPRGARAMQSFMVTVDYRLVGS